MDLDTFNEIPSSGQKALVDMYGGPCTSHDSRFPHNGPLTQLEPTLYDGERWHRVELGSCTLQIP